MKRVTIIGQGLAGSVLAFSLYKRGVQVRIVDNNWKNAASKVAAGMWNPVNFRRMIPGWRVEDLLPSMLKFFSELESELDVKLLHQKHLIRRIPDEASRKLWKNQEEKLQKYSDLKASLAEADAMNWPNGYGIIPSCGVLDIPLFLEKTKRFFINQDAYCMGEFSWNEPLPDDELIISCEGYATRNNPYFNWVPIGANHGEILEIKDPQNWNSSNILNCGKFLFKAPNGVWKAGSVYVPENEQLTPIDGAADEIKEPIEKALKERLSINNITVGIRPTSKDRAPVMGFHPETKNIGIFGGLGTKGVLNAPFFAEQFSEHICNGKEIDREVAIDRFLKKHYDKKN
ncbi:NAD(P)/FAD-dependent oxidoreductase [Luteibaculum oceani]|uniref:NAD(P)/FAD-dependent oxidoreductase n=1 Tax=Luteibaculum oceani TaxID=1294296 RepID=UPI001476D479|nr:FAD-binding oxidoreductase [Luteibaculum oceani]